MFFRKGAEYLSDTFHSPRVEVLTAGIIFDLNIHGVLLPETF
jgi:hypothetical protein